LDIAVDGTTGTTKRLSLTTTELRPATAGGLELGTASVPWGTLYGSNLNFAGSSKSLIDTTVSSDYALFVRNSATNGHGLIVRSQNTSSISVVFRAGNNTDDWFTVWGDGHVQTIRDVTIGSLGRFDSTDTPTDMQMLVYHQGVAKWQAESINWTVGSNDFHATLRPDGTAVAYVFSDPGSGAGGAINTPGQPTAQVKHKSIELRIPGDYVKTAAFRYFQWQVSVNDNGSPVWSDLITSTSLNIVHARLTPGNTYRYRVQAINRDGTNHSAWSPDTGNITAAAGSDTEAFGGIVAGNIAAVDFAALTGDLGILTVGRVQDAFVNPTSMINFGGKGVIPSTVRRLINFENISLPTWVNNQQRVYFNLNPSADLTCLRHDRFKLDYEGRIYLPLITVVLTSGNSWTVPQDFNPFMNTIELIGGGGGGAGGQANTNGGGGGGGGGYAKIVGFDPRGATSIPYQIGSGGTGGAAGNAGTPGGDTIWNNGTAWAKGGRPGGEGGLQQGGSGGGYGGNVAGGAQGGNGGGGSVGTGNQGGGGGGGAGCYWSGGSNGNNASGATGGSGGAGGAPGGGTGGSSGGGTGGSGSAPSWVDSQTSATAGAGGGGGGRSAPSLLPGGAGGNYGGGGAGGASTSADAGSGGNGAQGCIVIRYFPIGIL
jgi:hypothetical protein